MPRDENDRRVTTVLYMENAYFQESNLLSTMLFPYAVNVRASFDGHAVIDNEITTVYEI